MKKLFKISMLIAMLSIVFLGCKKDNNKISPPNWMQGKWGIEELVILDVTSNDIIISTVSLATTYPSNVYKWEVIKDNGNFYELKLTTISNTSAYAFLSFKKGDDTFIEWGSAANSTNVEEYAKLDKIN